MRLSNAAASAAADAAVALLDAGAGAGTLSVYDGTIPTDADTAVGSQVLLATLTLSDPAFGAAVDGVATADTITSDITADATGTATWARLADSDGNTVADLTVDTSGADINLDSVDLVVGASIAITSLTYTQPRS